MKKLGFILAAILLCMSFVLAACNNNPSGGDNPIGGNNTGDNSGDETYYTVTFDSQGGSEVESVRVLAGNRISSPTSPMKDGFEFDGWYRSASENAERWNFNSDRVNENLTLYARWNEVEPEEPPTPTETLTFERSGEGYIVTGDEGQATNIVIPSTHEGLSVIGIGERAFSYANHNSDILSVTIPDSVVTIGLNAFYSRNELTEVKIGKDSKLTTIENNAFSGCRALKSIYLPVGVNSLGDSVFNNCGGLNSITVAEGNAKYSGEGNCLIERASGTLIRGSNSSVIPSAVKTIGEAAFRMATLTTLTIPSSVTAIENYAIQNSEITKIVYLGTSEDWDKVEKFKNWNMGKKDV